MTTETGRGLYTIWGPPGTGKTSYLAEKTREFVQWASIWHPENRFPVLLCSLTRTAAAEIAGRDLPLPKECVGTLHSHAYRSLGCPPVAETLADDFNQAHPAYRITAGAVNADDPEWEDRRAATPGDELSGEYQLLRARMVDRKLWPSRVHAFADKWEDWKAEVGAIDFTDMIERAWREVDFAPGHPQIIIADEAQDLSALEFALLKRWGQACGHLIVTGDPYQSIYSWRGAHPEVFLDPDVPPDHRRVLSQSWRVPRAVHTAAMRWVEQLSNYQTLEYRPRDVDGRVRTSPGTWKAPDRAIDLAESYLAQGKTVMFEASCSFFLQPLVAALRRRGIPFANPWRTKRGDWNPLGGRGVTMARRIAEFLRSAPEAASRLWTVQELERWVSVLKADGLLMRGAKAEIAAAADSDTPVEVTTDQLMAWFNPDTYGKLAVDFWSESPATMLQWWRERLLPTKLKPARFPLTIVEQRGAEALVAEPRLYVGTIHSFKGGESEVTIIFPDLSPSGYRELNRPGEGKDSVIRLFYVAITRARETVAVCEAANEQAVNLLPLMEAQR